MREDGVSEIITGKEILARVREVCADQGDIYLAVAYWGEGAFDALRLTGDLKRVHVVLNVAHGGTSAAALEELRGKGLGGVKVNDRLHAKIFASAAGAVVGSANASSPGLWIDGSGHDEAAVWLPDGAGALERAKTLYQDAKPAEEDDVARCRKRFGKATLSDLMTAPARPGETALETLRRRSDVFEHLHFIVTDKNYDAKFARKGFREAAAKNPEMPIRDFVSEEWDCFQFDLPETYRGSLCVNLHKWQTGQVTAYLVRPVRNPDPGLHYAERLEWSELGNIGPHWGGKSRTLGQSTALQKAIAELAECELPLTYADILAALPPA